MTKTSVKPMGSQSKTDSDPYLSLLDLIAARIASIAGPVFKVRSNDLFPLFLDMLPGEDRQHYTCRACDGFITRYGGAVTVDGDGVRRSVLWGATGVPAYFAAAVERLRAEVDGRSITSILVTDEDTWGVPSNADKRPGHEGTTWRHLHGTPDAKVRAICTIPADDVKIDPKTRKTVARTQSERVARCDTIANEREQEYLVLIRAVLAYGKFAVSAVGLVDSGALYGGDRIASVADWFLEVCTDASRIKTLGNHNDLVRRHAALAPTGFCSAASSGMLGTLLEDIAKGLSTPDIIERFGAKMDPTRYRRSTTAPSVGQVDAAERAVQALGIAPAFARRYATMQDVGYHAPGFVWRESDTRPAPVELSSPPPGVFANLRPKATEALPISIPPKLVTWEKFARDHLPGASVLEYRVPAVGPFCALTTAKDPVAPPILKWDRLGSRNPVALTFPNPAARAEEWNLTPGALVRVRIILEPPSRWSNESGGKGIVMLLEGARDTRGLPGGGFFVEQLQSSLVPYRSTIEAHVNGLRVEGAEASDGFGVGFLADGGEWTEVAASKVTVAPPARGGASAPATECVNVILVVDNSPSMGSYLEAARRALLTLIASLPGLAREVYVTVMLFGGGHAYTIISRASVRSLAGIERNLNASDSGTALYDAVADAIAHGKRIDMGANEAGFIGIVTDGEDNSSRIHNSTSIAHLVREMLATGRWTITFAGCGRDPKRHALQMGIPEGNVATFEASDRGFNEVGQRYATSSANLGTAYASGAKSSNTFFSAAAAPARKIGTDHPVLVATMKSGAKAAFTIDRWE